MINYIIGDATTPIKTSGLRIIAHVCNNKFGWGSGFVVALSKKWNKPEQWYREWGKELNKKHKEGCFGNEIILDRYILGRIQMVPVKDEHGIIYVANMIAQDGFSSQKNPVALNYSALKICLIKLRDWIENYKELTKYVSKYSVPLENKLEVSVNMPRIGCGLGGGDWKLVSEIIEEYICNNTFVYDLPEKK